MLFEIFRIVFWGVIIASAIIILKKRKAKSKIRITIISIILYMVLCSLSFLLPIENLFINFKSPEDVFRYYQTGEIDDVIYGVNSSMVIYSKGENSGGHFIVPKTEKGYKIPSLFSVKRTSQKIDRDGSFDVYNILGTKDYFIVGTFLSEESDIVVVDSNDEPVKNIIIDMGYTDTKTILVFCFVEDFTDDYYLHINGEKIYILDI